MILLLQFRAKSEGVCPISCGEHLDIHIQAPGKDVPLALTATEIVLDIVDSVPGHGGAVGVPGGVELAAEDLVVLVMANLVDNDALLVVGDLEDNKFGLAVAQTEFIECSDALILNLNTVYRLSTPRSGGGRGD